MKRKSLILLAAVFLICFSAYPAFSTHQSLSTVSADADLYTGSSNLSIPIRVPTGRGGIQPSLQLQYSSSLPNDVIGLGWTMEVGSIQRSTKDGIPKYDNTDTFILKQNGSAQELVPIGGDLYAPKVEGAFTKIQFVDGDFWRLTDKKGIVYLFGYLPDWREYDPLDSTRTYKYCLYQVADPNANHMTFHYMRIGNKLYLNTITYTESAEPPFASVSFDYEARPDIQRNFRSGFEITTDQRLRQILIKVGPNLQRTYDLSYTISSRTQRSLLTGVTQFGANGVGNLPPVTMNYQDDVLTHGPADIMPNLFPDAKDNFAGDFDGDGKVDTAYYERNTGIVKVRLSQGRSFSQASVWSSNFGIDGTLFTGDFNGDGRVDIGTFHVSAGNWRVALSDGTQFVHDGDWITNFGLNEPDITTGDFNGDGLTDIASVFNNGGGAREVSTVLSTGVNFNPSSVFNIVVSDSNGSVFTGDFNGDGFSDFAMVILNVGHWEIKLNPGGYNLANWVSMPVLSGNGQDIFVVSDLDGDGMTDAGHLDYANGKIHYRRSTGTDFGPSEEFPVQFTNTSSQPQFFLRPADYDGDGIVDFMLTGATQNYETIYMDGIYPDLLSSSNNGVGGVTSIVYENSMATINSAIPFALQVVKEITISDSRGDSYTTTNEYQGGLWDQDERIFRGFSMVTTIDGKGHKTSMTYRQDDPFRGRVAEQQVIDASGCLMNKTVNTWDSQLVNPGVDFAFLKRKDNYVLDCVGSGVGRRTAEEFFYEETTPQYGNLTKAIQYGEVDYDTGVDIGSDKRTVETVYLNHTNLNWFVGYPEFTTVKDNDGNIVRKTELHPNGNAQLTRKVEWAGDAPEDVDLETIYTYDSYGNLETITDPMGNVTTITYDSTFHIFPVSTTNALGHTVVNEYYGVDAVPLDSGDGFSGLWGQLKSTTDPNQEIGKRTYNTLGDLVATVSPLDSITYPTQTTDIVFASDHIRITTSQRITHGQPETIDVVTFVDGLGRTIQTKTNSGNVGQYIVSGQTEYDSRGLPEKQYLNAFTSNGLTTIDAIDPVKPHATKEYDAARRLIKTTNPDGTYSNSIYEAWHVEFYNENGHRQNSFFDAYGRLIKKVENTGADGRSPHYPQTVITAYATTHYTYDSEGNLTQTLDDHNNPTTITYDKLGRKISMNDPDMGVWQYEYDLNGNLTKQTDARGGVIDFTYDALNRLVNKTDGADLNVNYTYDDPLLTHSKGRLTEAQYTGGKTEFHYDSIGREIQSIKEINSQSYGIDRNYDALNNLLDIQYPDGEQIFYKYNPTGQIEAISNDETLLNGQQSSLRDDKIDVIPAQAGIQVARHMDPRFHGDDKKVASFPRTRESRVLGHMDSRFHGDDNGLEMNLARSTQSAVRSTNFFNTVGSNIAKFYTDWFEPNILGIREAYAATNYTQDPSCVAAWQLDEASGTVIDACGNNNGTTSGSLVQGAVGKYGQAIDFPGVPGAGSSDNAKVNLGSDASVDNLAARTITAWIYPRSVGHDNKGTIINKDYQDGWLLRLNVNNKVAFSQAFTGGVVTWRTPTNSVQLNTWQHVAVVYAGSGINDVPTIYINGVAQSLTNPSPYGVIDNDASQPLQMGAKDSTQEFEGLIDEVAIFNRMLSQAEVNEIKDSSLVGDGSSPPPAPTATISASPNPITEGASTTLTWSSTNADTCTASNGWTDPITTSGNMVKSPTVTTTYDIQCTGAGGTTAVISETVTVSPIPTPTVTIDAAPNPIIEGASTTLTWSSTNADSCTASNGWTDPIGTSGNMPKSPTVTTTYDIQCTGPGGSTAVISETVTVNPPPSGSTTIEVRVSAGTDDAEEKPSLAVSLGSSDLELVQESATQIVGMRFKNLLIPQGSQIINAYVQFKVDEATTTATNLVVQAQASGDAPTFTTQAGDISNRPLTTASANWSPPAWNTVGQAGGNQRTSDIANVIQEVISRTDWASGNDLAIIISGSGKRVAESYNGDSGGAALLHIEYDNGPVVPTVTIDAAPNPITEGASTTLTWSSTNADSCTASNGWTDPIGTSGNMPKSPTVTTTYDIQCTGVGGTTAVESVTVTMNPPPPPGSPIYSSGFDTDSDGFTYMDDTFRGGFEPDFASGSYDAGNQWLTVRIGGLENNNKYNMSGGWKNTFTLSHDQEVTLTFSYNMSPQSPYENEEYSEVLASIDGQLVGTNGNDYIEHIAGGSPSTTGWQTVVLNLGTLTAGNHELILGGFNNKKSALNEYTDIFIDDVSLEGDGSMPPIGSELFVENVVYNEHGQVTQIVYGNGVTTTSTYNPLNLRLERIYTEDAQAAPLQDLEYTYDSVGNVLSITDHVNTADQVFEYDELGRLTKATGQTYGIKDYVYDEIGNIVEKDAKTYTYDGIAGGAHAVTSIFDSSTSENTTFTYDDNGNMATKQKGTEITHYWYDVENRLIKVEKDVDADSIIDEVLGEYEYDGDGGRTAKTVDGVTTKFVGSFYEENFTRTTKYIYLGNQRVASISNNNLLYYHADHLGGTNVLTDINGTRKELIEYQPFGKIERHEKEGTSLEVAMFYFTGQRLDDETGLMYYGARYYDPDIGRFITADSIVPRPNNPQDLNRYTYSNNNPVNNVDPSGHGWFKSFIRAFVGAFVRAVVAIVAPVLIPALETATALVGAISGAIGGVATAAAFGGDIGLGAGIGFVVGGAFGTSGSNGILGSAGPPIGLAVLIGGLGHSAAKDGWKGVGNFAAGVAGGITGNAVGTTVGEGIAGVLKGPETVEPSPQAGQQDDKTNSDNIQEANAQKANPQATDNGAKRIQESAEVTNNSIFESTNHPEDIVNLASNLATLSGNSGLAQVLSVTGGTLADGASFETLFGMAGNRFGLVYGAFNGAIGGFALNVYAGGTIPWAIPAGATAFGAGFGYLGGKIGGFLGRQVDNFR